MTNVLTSVISENLRHVRNRISEAALRVGRSPEDIVLVAVTKTLPAESVMAAWAAGQRHFGENRPEEGAAKIPQVRDEIESRLTEGSISDEPAVDPLDCWSGQTPDMPSWHMIGHVQSRKTEAVVNHFDCVHSVDRFKIARKLSASCAAAGREMPVLLECNVSGEQAKYGYRAAGWENDPATRAALVEEVERIKALPGLRLAGLMTVAPIVDNPDDARPFFASLRGLRDFLMEQIPDVDMHHLSMGMTSDFEVAVEEGATLVRVGRAIFGERHQQE